LRLYARLQRANGANLNSKWSKTKIARRKVKAVLPPVLTTQVRRPEDWAAGGIAAWAAAWAMGHAGAWAAALAAAWAAALAAAWAAVQAADWAVVQAEAGMAAPAADFSRTMARAAFVARAEWRDS